MPSSSTSAGILPSGLCWRTASAGSVVSAGSSAISRFEAEQARGDSDLADERRGRRVQERQHGSVPMRWRRSTSTRAGNWPDGQGKDRTAIRGQRRSQPVITRLTAFGPLPFLSGSTSKEMRCPSFRDLRPGPLDGGDVHEDVASSVIRLDETVAALGIEEFDRTCHGHRETPFPVVAPPSAPAARRLGRTFAIGESRRPSRPPSLRRPPLEAERQSQPQGIGQSSLWKSGRNYGFGARANRGGGRRSHPTRRRQAPATAPRARERASTAD